MRVHMSDSYFIEWTQGRRNYFSRGGAKYIECVIVDLFLRRIILSASRDAWKVKAQSSTHIYVIIIYF